MTILNTSPILKGRFTYLAHALFVCFSLIRLLGLLYIIVGTVLIVKDGVLQHATFPLLNQFVVHGMPLGDLSSGLVYGLFFLLPLHSMFGCLGLLGVVCHNKLLIVIYNVFLMFGIVIDSVFIALFSLIIDGINSWIKDRFLAYNDDFSAGRLNAEVKQAFGELFDAMDCTGATGTVDGNGCWDKYYPVMNGTLRVFIMLLTFNIVIQGTSMVLLEIIYRRVGQPEHKRSPGMYVHFFLFVRTSLVKNTSKFCFAVMQFLDVVCSALLFFGGIIITQSRFVTDSRLLPIFENMRFNNYYLPGIILGLGVTMIVIGCLNSVSCGVGCNMLCFKSDAKSRVNLTWQVVMTVVLIIGFTFWIYLLRVVYEGMFYQLYWEFLAYGGYSYHHMYYTRAWNSLFVTYSCCGLLDITKFEDTAYTRRIPYYCRLGATIANSDLDTITVPSSITGDYFNRVCETPLKEEIEDYTIFFGVTCGFAFVIKLFNIAYLYKYGFKTDSVSTDTSPWQDVKDLIKKNKLLVTGFAVFIVLGLLISLGILITGIRLYFDDILGHKDIKLLFNYIYIFGRDVTSWVSIMSKIMISTGCVSFVVFSFGIVSVVLGVASISYMALLALVTSLLFKLIAMLLWIPVRVSFDWNLHGEMYSALQSFYITDEGTFEDYLEDKNIGFNSLFYQGKCCLQQSNVFTLRLWIGLLSGSRPWTCNLCGDGLGVRWLHELSSTYNQCVGGTVHAQDCTTTVLDYTLHRYDTTAVTLSAVMILFEVMLIIILDRAFKMRVSPGEREEARGLFANVLLNNRFINNNRMPKYRYWALGLCLFKAASLLLEIMMTVGIIMEKFEPGYFDNTEQEFLNDVFSGDISLGYVTHALGVLLLTLTLVSFVINIFTIIAVLGKWKYVLFALSFVTIVFGACNVVIVGLLCRVLDVAYCCDKSPDCSYRTDTDSDTFQQFCNMVYHDNIHKVMGVSIAYLITMVILQVVCVVLSDRLYKRLQEQSDPEASGIFTSVWKSATNNRVINQDRMPNFTNLAAVFIALKTTVLVGEFLVFLGIILEKFDPNYFSTTEEVYLNNILSGDLTLGYVTHVTAIVMFCVIVLSFGLGVLGVLAVYKGWRTVMCVIVIPTLILTVIELICLGLLSLVLSVAYCCDYGSSCNFRTSGNTPSLDELCKHGFQGAVYNVVGTFIGFIVAHLVLQIVTLCLADRIHKRMSTKEAPDGASYGMFQRIMIFTVNNKFINKERMPNYNVLVAVLMTLKGITMVGEFLVFIAIILEKFDPNYFSTTEEVYLNNILSGDLTLGYVTHVTAIVMFCVIALCFGLGVLGVLAVYKGWRTVMCVIVIPTLILTVIELICLGLLSLVLSVAYCCDYGSSCTFRTSGNTPSLDELCKHGFQGAVYNVVGTFIGFIVAHLVLQIVTLCLADRIHKRMSTKEAPDGASYGMFQRILIFTVNNKFINKERMPNYNVLVAVLMTLKGITMVGEFLVFIAIILEKFDPNYFSTTEEVYLNNILSGDLTLGYVTHVTAIVMFCVIVLSFGLGVLGVLAVYKGWRTVMCVVVLLTLVLSITEIICLGLLSLVLSVAYCCDNGISCTFYTSSAVSLESLCKHGFQGAVYNVVGAFIGFIVAHLVLQIAIMGIVDRIYKRISTNMNKENEIEAHGLFRTILRIFVNNRLINQEKMPDFRLITFVYVAGNILMTAIDIATWVAVLVYVVRYDSQLDGMYVGTLYLGEMTRGASITLLVIIPISSTFNVCKVVWCVIKYNTGLLWSTLPEILRFIVDIVILGLYAQLLESVRLSDRGIYRVMYELTVAYLCVNVAVQLVLFTIKDRLYKRIENSFSVTDSSGLITWLWRTVVKHRFFKTDSGTTNKTAFGFCILSCFLVVWEFAVWIAVLLQTENPGYLRGTFLTELDQDHDEDYFWRLLVTLLVVEWFYIIFHVVTVVAVIKSHKPFLIGAIALLGCILTADIVTTGLASHWLDMAYNCSPSSSKFCSTHVSKLYELCGVFVGLNIAHLCLVAMLFGLCIYQLYTSATSTRISSFGDDKEVNRSNQGILIGLCTYQLCTSTMLTTVSPSGDQVELKQTYHDDHVVTTVPHKDDVQASVRPLTSSKVGSASTIKES